MSTASQSVPTLDEAADPRRDDRTPGSRGAIPLLPARLAAVCLSHGVVDFFSAIIIPILTVLEGRLEMSATQGAVIIAVGSLSSGLIQPLAAWASDRFDTRWFGTAGLIFAVFAVGSVGFVGSFPQLVLLQIIGTAGIGAFHPVSAAAMGRLSGSRRSLGVTWFYTTGMIGGIAGSALSPLYAKHFGLPAFGWLIPPGLACVLILAWAIHGIGHRRAGAHEHHAALSDGQRRERWNAVWLLYAGNAVRFTVNMALVYLLVRLCERLVLARAGAANLDAALRTEASELNGPMQAAMAVGMGAAGLLLGLLVRPRWEKTVLIAGPVLGSAAIAALPHAGLAWMYALAVLAGAAYSGVIPITISLAQRLLPHRTGLASGLMMGGAWAVACVGPPLSESLLGRLGMEGAFAVVAALLLVSGLVIVPMRSGLAREVASH